MVKTFIRMDRTTRTLKLTHVTDAGFAGTVLIPFSGPIGTEVAHDPLGRRVHYEEFFIDQLNLGDTDLEPYVIGMTRSVERRAS